MVSEDGAWYCGHAAPDDDAAVACHEAGVELGQLGQVRRRAFLAYRVWCRCIAHDQDLKPLEQPREIVSVRVLTPLFSMPRAHSEIAGAAKLGLDTLKVAQVNAGAPVHLFQAGVGQVLVPL